MLLHLLHLVTKALHAFPSVLGSNWTGIAVPLIISVLVTAITAVKDGIGAARRRLLGKAPLIGFAVGAAVYAALLLYCAATLVVREHEELAAARADLRRIHDANQYETSFLSSFAFTNTVLAFSYLQGLQGHSNDPGNPCRIRVTAPPENGAIRQTLSSIAGAMGCSVEMPVQVEVVSGSPEQKEPEAERGVVLIHASQENGRAEGFVTGMSNSFHVERTYALPKESAANLVWVEIGAGAVWRKD